VRQAQDPDHVFLRKKFLKLVLINYFIYFLFLFFVVVFVVLFWCCWPLFPDEPTSRGRKHGQMWMNC
jgi:hypothetical protein